MDRDIDAEENEAPVGKADSKLKTISHYAMLVFAPVMSVISLVIAVVAVTNDQSRSDRAQLSELTFRVDSLNASLSDAKGELDNLKFAMSREKTMHGDERKKMDERDTKIIQNVTRLQAKLKVTPTLEDQMREAASAAAATPTVASTVSAPAVAPTVAATDKKPATALLPSKGTEKSSVQSKSLKDSIEKFNRK